MNLNELLNSPNHIKLSIEKASEFTTEMTKAEYNKFEDALLDGKDYIFYLKSKLAIWEARRDKREIEQAKLFQTADLNNKGIAYEKEGRIQEAIEVYEDNLKIGYPAAHSYNRLMVLYRKLEKYDDEIRVLRLGKKLFKKEAPAAWNNRIEKATELKRKAAKKHKTQSN